MNYAVPLLQVRALAKLLRQLTLLASLSSTGPLILDIRRKDPGAEIYLGLTCNQLKELKMSAKELKQLTLEDVSIHNKAGDLVSISRLLSAPLSY